MAESSKVPKVSSPLPGTTPEQRVHIAVCLAAYAQGSSPERADERIASKALMDLLAAIAPGNSVEFRVPPFAAAQVVEGIRHRRGNPPATVECDSRTFIELATGVTDWEAATGSGRLIASGERSDLSGLFPILFMPLG
ncbi:MAG: hypothetical protein HQ526_05225 [Actinobacteria bacterium]|nr:hypothetical protein [Actinomycetota bacterium]